jgi:hypothetical protein
MSASGQYRIETWKTRWAINFERCVGLSSQLSTKAFGGHGSRHSAGACVTLSIDLEQFFERTNGGTRPTLAGQEFLFWR